MNKTGVTLRNAAKQESCAHDFRPFVLTLTTVRARVIAASDLQAFAGLLDARPIAGNGELTLELRGVIAHDWRATAKKSLPELSELVAERRRNLGELFQLIEPNIEESNGGIRDALAVTLSGDRSPKQSQRAVAAASAILMTRMRSRA